ncbi:uncharacterized protein LOC142334463 isoform X2 [Lycorma delicatula]|uniref:uncharacterized protein LOC142334463 isoform X2 n=1 Tax=Lycorma delicatula TaxID=130591 RepID=UPI003F510F1F
MNEDVQNNYEDGPFIEQQQIVDFASVDGEADAAENTETVTMEEDPLQLDSDNNDEEDEENSDGEECDNNDDNDNDDNNDEENEVNSDGEECDNNDEENVENSDGEECVNNDDNGDNSNGELGNNNNNDDDDVENDNDNDEDSDIENDDISCENDNSDINTIVKAEPLDVNDDIDEDIDDDDLGLETTDIVVSSLPIDTEATDENLPFISATGATSELEENPLWMEEGDPLQGDQEEDEDPLQGDQEEDPLQTDGTNDEDTLASNPNEGLTMGSPINSIMWEIFLQHIVITNKIKLWIRSRKMSQKIVVVLHQKI